LNFDAQNATAGTPRPDLALTGTFTGTVEADGTIQLTDLTAFQEVFATGGFVTGVVPLADLTLFSFNTNGGASSLDTAGSPANPINICQGGAVPFDPQCTSNFTVFYPAGTFAVAEQNGTPVAIAESQPVVTLITSVTTNPPQVGATAPEPRLCLITGLVLMGIGSVRRGKGR
jgi:hypothetical protein